MRALDEATRRSILAVVLAAASAAQVAPGKAKKKRQRRPLAVGVVRIEGCRMVHDTLFFDFTVWAVNLRADPPVILEQSDHQLGLDAANLSNLSSLATAFQGSVAAVAGIGPQDIRRVRVLQIF